ncbi:XDD4 family exosortase-dependent surface protein [Nostoc sp. 106C]|uniref:XDD4 family exosortase-dependent surface protein n=1 Tax=Nostoc sp. 106C TaxID=1932667 RepID=UPI000A397BFB|nr:XDD4 family exosortase-dependent surface protein [Nostoc sp. 106C]OUL34888.1 hypothetical protein BV375_03015 [Nostoc sp. 106C]
MSQPYSKQLLGYLTYFVSALAVVTAGQIPKANAATMTFSATGTNSNSGGTTNALGAKVVFDDSLISQGKLQVTLTNTGPGATVPSDILTALFWDITGNPTGLSLSSAIAPKVVADNGASTTTNVDLKSLDEWKLPNTGNGSAALPGITQNYGIGTAGLGIFQGGGGQQFNYGIISGYDSPNPAVAGGTFVKDSATFVLSGLSTNFNIQNINNVRFQYGTALNEPSITKNQGTYYTSPPPPPQQVPEPATNAALGLLAVSALKVLKKKALVQV